MPMPMPMPINTTFINNTRKTLPSIANESVPSSVPICPNDPSLSYRLALI